MDEIAMEDHADCGHVVFIIFCLLIMKTNPTGRRDNVSDILHKLGKLGSVNKVYSSTVFSTLSEKLIGKKSELLKTDLLKTSISDRYNCLKDAF